MRRTVLLTIAVLVVAAPLPAPRVQSTRASLRASSEEPSASRVYLPYVARVHVLPGHAFAPSPTPVPRSPSSLDVRAVSAFATANQAVGLALDPATGDVWVASAHGGVVRWSAAGVELARYTVADGLPSNRTHGIAVAGDGTVWVATERGAARRAADGVWTTVRPPLEGDGDALPRDMSRDLARDHLTHVAVDAQGGVWFGRPVGVIRFGPEGLWETPAWSMPARFDARVASIRPAPNGDVWVGTFYNGAHVRRANGRWEDWSGVGGYERVADVAIAPDGDVIALHGDAGVADDGSTFVPLSRLGSDGVWRPERIGGLTTLPGNDPRRLAIDDRGRIWMAFGDGRLVVPDPLVPKRWRVESDAEGLRVVYVGGLADLALDEAAKVWIATDAGLQQRRSDGSYARYLAAGMRGATGEVVAAGPDGVWFGGLTIDGGVAHLAADGSWRAFGEVVGQSLADVWDIAVGSDGAAWFGLPNGVVRRDGTGRWAALSIVDDAPFGTVTHVAIAPDGTGWWLQPWAAFRNGGSRPGPSVCRAPARSGAVACDAPSAGLPRAIPSALAVAADGTVWVSFFAVDDGSGGGTQPPALARRSPSGAWVRVALPTSIQTEAASLIAAEPSGAIWLRLSTSVARRDPDGRWTTAADDASLALDARRSLADARASGVTDIGGFAVSGTGQLWVGGGSSGVAVRQPDGTWRSLEIDDGLPPGIVTDIAPTAEGRIWLGTDVDGAWAVDLGP